MDVLRALPLSLRSTRNARYTDHTEQVVTSLRNGHEIAEALYETRAFPADFLDAVEVGERSGRLPESLANLSTIYQDQANVPWSHWRCRRRCVWAGVALLIIIAIFRLAMNYVNMINGFVNDPMNYNP
jgi:cytochrome c biogenesis factor